MELSILDCFTTRVIAEQPTTHSRRVVLLFIGVFSFCCEFGLHHDYCLHFYQIDRVYTGVVHEQDFSRARVYDMLLDSLEVHNFYFPMDPYFFDR